MNDAIKTFIALAVILCSYFLGSHVANENCSEESNALIEQIKSKAETFKDLQDSLTLVKKQLSECSSRNDDTLKIQLVENPRKRTKK